MRKHQEPAGPGHALPVAEVRFGAHLPPPAAGPAPHTVVSARWERTDTVGAWKVRWGVGRMNYRVPPGLYAVNSPDRRSPVLVSANYKLSFDILRRAVGEGRPCWILALDTDGVNVWCAAGKGTFGTNELVRRVRLAGLEHVVDHRRLVVPQLGAPGVAAREVKQLTGFRVVFGPVRAADLPAFLDGGLKASPSMRKVSFTVRDRLVLVPMELVPALRWSVPVLLVLLLLGGLGSWGFSLDALVRNGVSVSTAFLGALFSGAVLTPLLLPWVPGRAFAAKGFLVGLAWAAFAAFAAGGLVTWLPRPSPWDRAAWFLALPALSAFLAMNFTGSSTVTSLSGVRREMRLALPLQAAGAAAGLLLWCAGHFRGAF